MLLLSQQECNLKAAAMKFNYAMYMITAACILKSFLNSGLHGQFFMRFESILGFHKLYPITPVKGAPRLRARDHTTCTLNLSKSRGIQSQDRVTCLQQMFLNNTLNFFCDMPRSPDMFAWYFWSILILFFLFQINVHFFFPLKYIFFIYENKGYTKESMRPFMTMLFSRKS